MSDFTARLRGLGALSVARAICDARGIRDVELLFGRDRHKSVSGARHELMAWLRARVPELSYPDIGRLFDRDHTTVIHAVNSVNRLILAGNARVEARHRLPRDPDGRRVVAEPV